MRELEFELNDGVRLAAHAWGDPGSPPVLLSHGGGQTRHSWGGTAERLARHGWYAIAYDHRGHGDSSWSEDGGYEIDRFARDQRELASRLSSRPVVVGASLGGISAMLAEGESKRPVFRSIVLVDIVPHMDLDAAGRIVGFMGAHMEEGFGSLEEAADVIAEYTGRPRRRNLAGLGKNLRLGDDGRYRWHWDPQFVAGRASREDFTQPERLARAVRDIDLPMLLVRGAMSELVTEARARDFLALAPNARHVDVANARHMVAGDRNDIFSQAVVEFLDAIGGESAAS